MTILLFESSWKRGDYEYIFGLNIEHFDIVKIANIINKKLKEYESYYPDSEIEYRFDEDEMEKLLSFITKKNKEYLYLGENENNQVPFPTSFRIKLLYIDELIKV